MWKVLLGRRAEKELDEAPTEIQLKLEAWVNVAKVSGVLGMVAIRGYRDHALEGKWNGARSSSLNKSWRVIYFVKNSEISILVVRISNHDYR
jgi:addiction module RelE/StbE family toxin